MPIADDDYGPFADMFGERDDEDWDDETDADDVDDVDDDECEHGVPMTLWCAACANYDANDGTEGGG